MRKSFILACFIMLAGLLIAVGPAAYGMMTGGCAIHTPAEHGCTGYGGMMNHPQFNDHCNHEAGNYPGGFVGAGDCCGDPGWEATHPPAPPSSSSGGGGAGITSAGNDAKTVARSVSTRPRSISRSVNSNTGGE